MADAAWPLAGLRVLDLTRLVPGPFLSLVLADLGADVVKVEDPAGGDYLRAVPPLRGSVSTRFLALNRDKRSVALDLKSAAGRDSFLRLAARADVVLEGFRPGVMDRLGLSWDVLGAGNPRLVLASISGHGPKGPHRERAGHDLDFVALSGVLAMTGLESGAPVIPGVQLADLAGGALYGAVAVLAALVRRGSTGLGDHLQVDMTGGALSLLAAELAALVPGEPAPTRGTGPLNGGLAWYRVYETRDGKYLAVACLEPKFYQAFQAAIGRPADLTELAAPPERQAELAAEVQSILGTRTRAEWESVFASVDACVEPVLEPAELAVHPASAARFFERTERDGRAMRHVRLPLGTPRPEGAGARPAPGLGEHTAEVLSEWGMR